MSDKEKLQEELDSAKRQLDSLESSVGLPIEAAKEELDWLDKNFATLAPEEQALILDTISNARSKAENTTTWNTLP